MIDDGEHSSQTPLQLNKSPPHYHPQLPSRTRAALARGERKKRTNNRTKKNQKFTKEEGRGEGGEGKEGTLFEKRDISTENGKIHPFCSFFLGFSVFDPQH